MLAEVLDKMAKDAQASIDALMQQGRIRSVELREIKKRVDELQAVKQQTETLASSIKSIDVPCASMESRDETHAQIEQMLKDGHGWDPFSRFREADMDFFDQACQRDK